MSACGDDFYLQARVQLDISLVRYRVEPEKIKFVSTSGHVIFCLLHKHTNDDVFHDFSKISGHFPFPEIFEESSKVVRRQNEHFRTFSGNFRR